MIAAPGQRRPRAHDHRRSPPAPRLRFPRRREDPHLLGLPLVVRPAEVDESVLPGEAPLDYLARVTELKLGAALAIAHGVHAAAILVADTTVILDGRSLGKPADEAEARAMIGALAGRAHEVATRFALAGVGDDARVHHAETVLTSVFFRPLSGDEIAAYAASGEGLDKAGAYAIQGLGAFAVSRIEGSYSNVVGLPACEVIAALRATGLLGVFPLPRKAA
ncbi:MAG: Maf family protein [Byssovorax sp.]